MSKPVIGVVADVHAGSAHVSHGVHEKYLDAIAAGAGGLAWVIPGRIDQPGGAWTDPADFDQLVTKLDGLFLSGALSNVAPARYGATLQDQNSPADPARDHAVFSLLARAFAANLPVLGVCRGFQEINVALGGTLLQAVHDTPGRADHRQPKGDTLAEHYAPAHPVAFTAGGMLARLTGASAADVNSLHGQGVDRLAAGLAIEAVAPDGLIEAFSGIGDAFLLGVQWHPEWAFRDNPVSRAIFGAFGDACRARANAAARPARQAA